jgi:hypothetical protein
MSGQRILYLHLQACLAQYLQLELIFSESEHFDLLNGIFDFTYLYAVVAILFVSYFK